MVSEYKKTPLGFLPQSWKVKKLRDVATRITEKNKDRTDNVLTISAKFGLVNQKEFFNKSVASKNLSGYYYLQKGDFAYNKSYSEGYPFGAIKMLERYDQGIVSTLYICFRLTGNNTDSLFYKYYFDSNLWNEEVRLIAKEGGRSHGLLNVGVDEFFDILLPLPPLEEQRKIAAILSSVDEAIEKTEVIIEQTEKVKKGLMQQLLTKGIGHTKFKKTEIGEIPEEWEVKALENISKFIDYRGKTPKKTERGIRLITAKNIRDGYISDEPIEFIAEEDYDSWMTRGIPEYGDVLFTTEAPLGNIAQLNIREKVAFAQRVIIIQPIIDKRFMKYVLMGERFQNEIESLSTGSTVKGIKSSVLKKVKIPVPPLEEQRRIGAILESFEGKLLTEKQKLERLKFIKIGLMQVLLTGKVRVKVDDEVMSQ